MYYCVLYLQVEDFQLLGLPMSPRGVCRCQTCPDLAHNFCLQPHICNDNRLRQASEKCLLLYDSSHHMNVHKRNNSIAIPKSNYYNKCKNQTRTKPELKWWKSSALLHNVKHTQKATFCKTVMLITITGKKWFQVFLSPSKKERQTLKWHISKGHINKKRQHFFWFFLQSYFTHVLEG